MLLVPTVFCASKILLALPTVKIIRRAKASGTVLVVLTVSQPFVTKLRWTRGAVTLRRGAEKSVASVLGCLTSLQAPDRPFARVSGMGQSSAHLLFLFFR
jgi:hypothetical protein